jgi:Flp pilus assembly protein TadG
VGAPLLSRGAGERASAAVEFALVLPLVLIMALAVLEVGLLVKDQLVVEECARAGARQASVSTDDGSVRSAAIEAAASLDPNRLDVSVSRSGGVGTAATVTVGYADTISVPLVTWLFPSTVQLRAQAVMRQEGG